MIWKLYILVKLDAIVDIFNVLGILAVVSSLVFGFLYLITYSDPEDGPHIEERYRPMMAKTTITFILSATFFLTTATLIPTTKQALMIWGGAEGTEFIKNSGASKLPEKAIKAIEQWLDGKID